MQKQTGPGGAQEAAQAEGRHLKMRSYIEDFYRVQRASVGRPSKKMSCNVMGVDDLTKGTRKGKSKAKGGGKSGQEGCKGKDNSKAGKGAANAQNNAQNNASSASGKIARFGYCGYCGKCGYAMGSCWHGPQEQSQRQAEGYYGDREQLPPRDFAIEYDHEPSDAKFALSNISGASTAHHARQRTDCELTTASAHSRYANSRRPCVARLGRGGQHGRRRREADVPRTCMGYSLLAEEGEVLRDQKDGHDAITLLVIMDSILGEVSALMAANKGVGLSREAVDGTTWTSLSRPATRQRERDQSID